MARCFFCDHENPADATKCAQCGSELPTTDGQAAASADSLLTLVQQGKKIEAIKLWRDRTGASLSEAKDAVEALASGNPLPTPKVVTVDDSLLNLLRDGKKIEAIKAYRNATGAGLAESKMAVEALAQKNGIQMAGSGCAGVLLIAITAVTLLSWC